jgi:hypothetical protein
MKTVPRWIAIGSTGLWAAAMGALAAGAAAPTGTPDIVISFAAGQWDTNRWQPVRMINQERPISFTQYADRIGTTTNTFTPADYSKERDNALLVYDTGSADSEIEVAFGLGWGFSRHSSPGVCLSPRIRDGMFESGIAVFVGTYAVVIWYEYVEGGRTRYAHLAQLARRNDPAQKHVLRCRFSKAARSVAVKIDDSDVLVLQFVGDSRLSYVPHEINSLVALWGCHGACDFYEMKVRRNGTLPFLVRD